MSVEFQLDHQDHYKVEDFLSRAHAGVGAITLHAKRAKYQQGAADAAVAAGLEVLYDPRTERLDSPGLTTLDGLPGYHGEPYDLGRLAADLSSRQRLVAEVIEAHPDFVTVVTPPHFMVRDDRTAQLNLALAEAAALTTDKPVRPVLTLRARINPEMAAGLARDYAAAGFGAVDLRFTPLGSENDSILKIRSVFRIADMFRDAGMRVILGRSGNVGRAGFALGHVDGFSVGVGQMEHVNHAVDVSRQNRPPKLDENGNRVGGGVWQGVYLPGIAATLSMARAKALLEHSDIRTRLGCRIDACGRSLLGPVDDYRSHYMHARASEVAALISTPEPWRAKRETDRLRRAIELRELVNSGYRSHGDPELKTRTLRSLVDGIEEERAVA
ncbi:hypothetical protein [Microbacterium kunmingense]|uniref:hypothetical protein n=1 Tax=Microbacterium kunmingense TaxID=2915939 RepID=UPI00200355A3|nr:hypothetical protein [Microbacterium kunmingense]